jgi:acetolactate synthase-like protein
VKFVFTLVGGHISPILVAAEAAGIRVVDTRHEVSYHSYFLCVV